VRKRYRGGKSGQRKRRRDLRRQQRSPTDLPTSLQVMGTAVADSSDESEGGGILEAFRKRAREDQLVNTDVVLTI